MDSRLDSIFKTRFRHAEPLDTRQAIRRHDQPDSNNRKKDGRKDDDKQDLWEDQTTVSIRALKTFLRQLVTQQPAQAPQENGTPKNQQKHKDNQQGATPPASAPPAPAAARAASAYQRTYNATHDESIGGDAPQSGALPDIELAPDEIRTIHKLIDALEQLDRANIDYLTLRKHDSFLQSLVEAVERIK